MAKAKKTDMYANLLEVDLTMSAVNVLTFEEINLGLTLFDKIGLLINRIEYEVPLSAINSLAAGTDQYTVALVADNSITALDFGQRSVIDMAELMVFIAGTPGNIQVMKLPIVKDYSTLPGGGLLVAPRPLYLGLVTAGFTSASAVTMRLYFTVLPLSPEDYFELLESRRFFQ